MSALSQLTLVHSERGDLLYRHLRRLLAPASQPQCDAACLEVWRRAKRSSQARPAEDPWLILLREAYLVAADHPSRQAALPVPPLAPEVAAAGHAAWIELALPSPDTWPADPAQAADLARWRQLGNEVLIATAELPLPHRAAILLHHDLMLPLADIATVLDQAVDQVRPLVWTALLHLRCRVGATLASARDG